MPVLFALAILGTDRVVGAVASMSLYSVPAALKTGPEPKLEIFRILRK
jgi:hypothetical protein